jgi:repressor LexA
VRVDTKKLTRLVSGLTVSGVSDADGALSIQFTNGSTFVIEPTHAGLAVTIIERDTMAPAGRPSRRQREYLEFIRKYMARYGVAPAESDIQRHFLVSAPSVNQMVRSLERRGFIARGRDPLTGQAIPRSIRILVDGV